MKKLHLIRHAKSDWKNKNLSDIERPLNQRGVDACGMMAPAIVAAGCRFEHVFCSEAVRTQETIELLAAHLAETMSIEWKVDLALYTFDAADLMRWVTRLDDAIDSVVIVGHNPAITIFCNQIAGSQIDNVPTCGYAQIDLGQITWQAVEPGSGQLVSFLTPKQVAQTSP